MSEYVPFGDEWKKHVAKLPKRELVEMLAKALREKQEVQLELFYVQKAAQHGVHWTSLESGEKISVCPTCAHIQNHGLPETQSQ